MARVEVDVRMMIHEVIEPVRNQFPLTRRAKIVVKGFHGLSSKGRASPVKIPQQFLLFRIDGNHRIAGRLVLAP